VRRGLVACPDMQGFERRGVLFQRSPLPRLIVSPEGAASRHGAQSYERVLEHGSYVGRLGSFKRCDMAGS
jgi:hypothetical protein